VRALYLTDRLSIYGGADLHVLQVMAAMAESGASVTVAYGRRQPEVQLAPGVESLRIKGLAAMIDTGAGLSGLTDLVRRHQVVHAQNVMNPTALSLALSASSALVTVQDHRVLCPGPGKTLPNGKACRQPMSDSRCAECLPDREYRQRTLDLTRARLDALGNARLVVLSHYMAEELAAVGLAEAEVLYPWVETGPQRTDAGYGFLLGGRLVLHKGVKMAWRAWQDAATGHPLRVAGTGPMAAQLDGAELLGWLSPSHLRLQIRQARALLFPSLWQEPFGILGIEALAEGTPVVVVDSGGTGEWSDAGSIHIQPGDTNAMAAAIKRLAEDPQLAVTLGRQGQAMVAQRFARGPIEARLQALYRRARHQ
jgi:glycosyltransferase involved in cell wall biosynthesis